MGAMVDFLNTTTVPRDTSVPWSPYDCRGNGDHSAPLNEVYRSFRQEGMNDSVPSLAHTDASTPVSSIKSLDVEDGNIDEDNGKASKETCDDGSSLLGLSGSVDDKELFRHDHSLELDDDGDQADAVSRIIEPDNTVTQTSKFPRKSCATQTSACAEVRVGSGDVILRWRRGSELTYVICEESFPAGDSARVVKAAMLAAIAMWKGIGVRFRQVDRHYEATFAVIYENFNDGVYAVSFFPKDSAGKLVLHKLSLSNTGYLANILAHEIGHILGLRHEFAHERELFDPCSLIGRENTNSIMNYFKQLSKYRVTEQDLQELEKFYAYDEGELSISDIDPKIWPFCLLSNSLPMPPVNSAAVSATHISAYPFLNHLAVNPAMLYRTRMVIFMLSTLFMSLVILILSLFVHLL